jgi:tetratricopeptide (TPR) repeat protein
MDNTEYIESYFTSTADPDQARSFEKRISSDPAFAEEVAFYLSVHTLAGEVFKIEKKQHFREIYQKHQLAGSPALDHSGRSDSTKVSHTTPVRKLIYYMAAAAVVAGISFGIYTYVQTVSPPQLASKYELDHLKTLPVTMSGRSNSIQTGLRLYNDGKLNEARSQFETIIQNDSTDFNAKKYAGLVLLRLKDYDQAMSYFKQLETYTSLYSNPALFYQALTLMERNQPGDAASAKQLLQQVVENDLEGKEIAENWLRKW